MRISKVVLSDDEIAAQMRAAAPEDAPADETQAQIDAALAERKANSQAQQAAYEKGRGTVFTG